MKSWVGAFCERCGEWGACWDGICQECIPTLDPEPFVTSPPPPVRSGPVECVNCGGPITGPGEFCPRCYQQICADVEGRWRDRYAS